MSVRSLSDRMTAERVVYSGKKEARDEMDSRANGTGRKLRCPPSQRYFFHKEM